MADPDQDPELLELEGLEKKKVLYGWDDENPRDLSGYCIEGTPPQI